MVLDGMFDGNGSELNQLLDQITVLDAKVALLVPEAAELTAAMPTTSGTDAGPGLPGPPTGIGPGVPALNAMARPAEILGISPDQARSVIVEADLDMSRVPSADHMASQAGAVSSCPAARVATALYGNLHAKTLCMVVCMQRPSSRGAHMALGLDPEATSNVSTSSVGRRDGASLLVDALIRAGVRDIFGVPGDTGVVLYDALYERSDEVRHILARDERHAAFMADCYARTTNRVGVVEVSSGGGSTYAVGGLGEAHAASVPVLLISTDITLASRGTGALTELDQETLFTAVTKWRTVVTAAADIPAAVAQALSQATTGRPGPVTIIVPENVLDEVIDFDPDYAGLDHTALEVPRTREAADPELVQRAAHALSGASRPAIVAGGGVHLSQAWAELQRLADLAGIPVATTIHGKGSISDDSPWHLGIVGGNGGSNLANDYLKTVDAVLFVGTRANATDTDQWTVPPRSTANVIHLDISAERAGVNYPGSIGLVGDARTVLRQLNAAVEAEMDSGRRDGPDDLAALLAMRRPTRPTVHVTECEQEKLSSVDVFLLANDLTIPRLHLVIADPGTPTPHMASLWQTPTAGRFALAPRGHGPMGYAIPAAIGAAVAHPEASIVAFVGDGSFAMACGELETARRLNLPIVFVQLTNQSLGWIKMLQHLYEGKRYFGVDPGPTDAVLVARASGLQAIRAQSLAQFRSALESALESRKPTYIDVPVHHLIDEVPPVSSWHAALAGHTKRPTY